MVFELIGYPYGKLIDVSLWSAEADARLRREMMAWLTVRSNDGADALTYSEISRFTFEGERFPLLDLRRGIRKPAMLTSALSIKTVFRPEGLDRPYEDRVGPDGLIRYKWREGDPDQSENRALRTAMLHELPLVWFFGVARSTYLPVFPVYLLREEPEQQQFVVDAVSGGSLSPDSPLEGTLRRYIRVETNRRLHQPIFRAQVIQAYATRCAVCALGHSELLDAAHIVPDKHPSGIAAVRNGLALCKIHHAAFDANILGVRPDLVVQIRDDLLTEVDGPMLQHGLKERHGKRLMVLPRSRLAQPDPELLRMSFDRFLAG